MYNKQLLQIFEQTPVNKRKSKRIIMNKYFWCTWYRAVKEQGLLDNPQTKTWRCCLGTDIAQTLKTIADKLKKARLVVSYGGV